MKLSSYVMALADSNGQLGNGTLYSIHDRIGELEASEIKTDYMDSMIIFCIGIDYRGAKALARLFQYDERGNTAPAIHENGLWEEQ